MRRLLIQLLTLSGLAASLLSCVVTWLVIPVGAEPLSVSPSTIYGAQPAITVAFRIACIAVLVILVIAWGVGRSGSVGLVTASLWFALLFAYPFAVMNGDPYISGNAAWLEAQHRNLVWSSGDLAMSDGYRNDGVLDRIFLTQAPRTVNPVDVGQWQPSELSLARLPELVDRLGYSNKFFEFLRLGWVAALGGVMLLLVGISAPCGYLDLGRLMHVTAVSSAALILLCLMGWVWSFSAAAELAFAAKSTAGGEYQAALDAMQRAERKLPVLAEDSSFIAQTGLLEHALGRDTPAVRLYQADLDDLAGKHHQADMGYEQLATDAAAPAPIRREAYRAILRSGVDALNGGRPNAAAAFLEKVLAAEPCNLKANYALQFAYLRTGRYKEVPDLAKRLEAVYLHFQFPSKLAVVSASYQNAVVANASLGNTELAIVHGRKVIKP